MARLITEWSTDDPQLAEMLKSINDIPEFTPEREEAEAALHTFQARLCWQRAERMRVSRAGRRPRAKSG